MKQILFVLAIIGCVFTANAQDVEKQSVEKQQTANISPLPEIILTV